MGDARGTAMSQLITFVLLIVLTVPMAHASEWQKGSRTLKRMLEERYRPLQIEVNDTHAATNRDTRCGQSRATRR